jgi:hypothetical protein
MYLLCLLLLCLALDRNSKFTYGTYVVSTSFQRGEYYLLVRVSDATSKNYLQLDDVSSDS